MSLLEIGSRICRLREQIGTSPVVWPKGHTENIGEAKAQKNSLGVDLGWDFEKEGEDHGTKPSILLLGYNLTEELQPEPRFHHC